MIHYIFICIAVLVSVLVLLANQKSQQERFLNPIPSSSATTKTGQADQTNANWRQILTYLQQNPQNSGAFLKYLQDTFFEGKTCSVKVINFSNLADTYTPLFT
jgi:transposase